MQGRKAKVGGERTTAGNRTLAIGGISCYEDSFVVSESFVLRNNIFAKKPAHRKSAKSYSQWLNDQNQ